jgi:prepilin peptidase CpaA
VTPGCVSWTVLRALLLVPWLAALCAADWKTRRLPNALTLGGLAVGLAVDLGWGGVDGLLSGLEAAGVSALFLLPPFLVRAAGAGDLKMLAACGAFVGMGEVLPFLLFVSFAGFFVAVAMVVARRTGAARLKHAFRTLFDWRYDRKAGRAALPPKEDEAGRVPFGLAIAMGTLATLVVEACRVC